MLAEKLVRPFDFLQDQVAAPHRLSTSARPSVKLVELADAGKGVYRLERYAIEPLPKDVVVDGNIANLDQVSDALKRACKRLGSRNRNVALALPAAMVITKKIIVPADQREEELELRSRPRPTSTSRSRSTRSTSTSRCWARRPTTPTRSRC